MGNYAREENLMRSLWKLSCALLVLGLLVVGVSACGGGSDSSSTTAEAGTETGGGSGAGGNIEIDVGTHTLEFPQGTEPKIALFSASGTAYQEAAREGVEEAAKRYGYEVTDFDNKFDPTTQLSQMQTALSGGGYNAWISESNAGKILCKTIQDAGEKNIAVVQVTNFTCDQEGKPAGEESWTPGTLASVSAQFTVSYYEGFAKKVSELAKPGAEVGVLNGPPTIPTTAMLKDALEKAGLDPVEEANTNYTTPEGLAEAQNMLQAHPGISVIVSIYSDLTVGATRAIEAAGKEGQIELFDMGASKSSVKLIEEGKLTMSVPDYPRTGGEQTVEVLHEAFEGKPIERFYPALGQGTATEPFFVTKENVNEFEPEY